MSITLNMCKEYCSVIYYIEVQIQQQSNDSVLFENKQKELKGTLNSLLYWSSNPANLSWIAYFSSGKRWGI
jgi:hypothetical protein